MISSKPQLSSTTIEQSKPHLTHQQIYEQILQRAKEQEIKQKQEQKLQKKKKKKFQKQKHQKITPLPSKLIKSANVVTTRTTIDTDKPSSISLNSMNVVHELKPPDHKILELDDQTIVESIVIQEIPQAVIVEEKVEEHPQYTSLKVIGEEKRKDPQKQPQEIHTLKRVPEETHLHLLPHDQRTLKNIEMRKYLVEKYTPHPQHKYTPEPIRQNIVHQTAPPIKKIVTSGDEKVETQSEKKIPDKNQEKPMITIQLKSVTKMQEQKAIHAGRQILSIPLKQVPGTWQQPSKVKEEPKIVQSQIVKKNVEQLTKNDLASSFEKKKQQRDLAPQKYDFQHQVQKPINVLHAEQMLNKQNQQDSQIDKKQSDKPQVQDIQKDVQDKIKKIVQKPFLRVHQRYFLQPKKQPPAPIQSIMTQYMNQVAAEAKAQQGIKSDKKYTPQEKKTL